MDSKLNFENNCLKHSVFLRICYADVDKMGVVYNGNYLRFFEIGRTELMRSIGIPYTSVEERGYLLPLVEAKIKWKGSAHYDDLIEIVTTFEPENIGSTIRFDYLIKVEDCEIASGYTIHCFVSSENFKPVKPPKFFLEIIENINQIV